MKRLSNADFPLRVVGTFIYPQTGAAALFDVGSAELANDLTLRLNRDHAALSTIAFQHINAHQARVIRRMCAAELCVLHAYP